MSLTGSHVLEEEATGRLVWNEETGIFEPTKEDDGQ